MNFSTAFHPQLDSQSERTIQTLEGILSGFVFKKEIGMNTYLYYNSLTIIVIIPWLVWHSLKLYMAVIVVPIVGTE